MSDQDDGLRLFITDILILFSIGFLSVQFFKFVSWSYIYIRASTLPRYLPPQKKVPNWSLVTGATDGVGLALAHELALHRNSSVIIHGRNPTKLATVASSIRSQLPPNSPIRIETVAADVVEPIAASRTIATFLEGKNIRISLLVNCVGGTVMFGRRYDGLDEISEEAATGIINLNTVFPAMLTRAVKPRLARPACIINLGSYAGTAGFPFLSFYAASKSFNMTFSTSLNREMHALNQDIEVLGVVLGSVRTESSGLITRDASGKVGLEYPAFFIPTPEDMANAILARVGCGRHVVVGYLGHALQAIPMEWLPNALTEVMAMEATLRRWKAERKGE
ncbi:NAD(P)-binding protein [Eremomyces bilateralis CBS 781.70]|uniref:NAD(P)-binding protein n=1 Tax=Eremomyces bilateralis CBS 781.70 TaxID=1392243 RepID=A0A6G1G1S0_9PEZI|nr:NAD(P)-binding protein [Eremomyces bilateralis CBS 781.70]KAF1811871.1 NAD(P)-binding protein [Eremomyces bilateralis CBS 781.70]